MINVDTLSDQAVQMCSALEELRRETEEAWQKLARPLVEVIEANNNTGIWVQKHERDFGQCEDVMDGRVAANRVKLQELHNKVHLYSWICFPGLLSVLLAGVVGGRFNHSAGSEQVP